MWRQKIVQLIDDLEERTKEELAYVTGKVPKPAERSDVKGDTSKASSSAPSLVGEAKTKKLWGKAKAVTKFTSLIAPQLGTIKPKRLNKQQRGRSVRVFVSSTFRDFAKERDYLNAHVFPKLKQLCQERGVFFAAIDLRWGVTAEESGRGDVIKLCLEQIDACYPFFIGMLGDRYGWHLPPTEKPWVEAYEEMNYTTDTLLETTFQIGEKLYPWVSDCRQGSVTEIELRHAVLNDLETTEMNASFYLRDTDGFKKAENVPEEENKTYSPETPYAKMKQTKLRQEIAANKRFPVLDGYRTLVDLGDSVLRDLTAFIDAEFPTSSDLSEVAELRLKHESFAHTRLVGYVPRMEQVTKVDSLLTERKDNEAVILIGAQGSGKTCLLCKYGLDAAAKPDIIVVMHFVGLDDSSKDHKELVWRIYEDLKDRLGLDLEVPTSSDERIAGLSSFLAGAVTEATKQKKRILLIVDGVDDLNPQDMARSLWWIQGVQGLELLVGTRDPKYLEQAHHWPTFTLDALDDDTVVTLIESFLGEYGKKLGDELTGVVLAAEQTRNPHFLRILLEEIILFGDFFRLKNCVESYLACRDTTELFVAMLGRLVSTYEADDEAHDGINHELVQTLFCSVLLSRDGLTEDDLLLLLGREVLPGEFIPMPRAGASCFGALRIATQTHFTENRGCLMIVDAALREGCKSKYMPQKESELKWRHKLARFFGDATIGHGPVCRDTSPAFEARQLLELPFHLSQIPGEGYLRLEEWLTTPANFMKMAEWQDVKVSRNQGDQFKNTRLVTAMRKKEDLFQYWKILSEDGGVDVVDVYTKSVNTYREQVGEGEPLACYLFAVAHFFRLLAKYDTAIELCAQALDIYRSINDATSTALTQNLEATICCVKCLCELATMHHEKDEIRLANETYSEALSYYNAPHGSPDGLLHPEGDLDEGVYYRRILNNKGCILTDMGLLDEAIQMHSENVEAKRAGGVLNELAFSLSNLGLVYEKNGQYEESLKHYEEARLLHQRKLGMQDPHVAMVIMNMGSAYENWYSHDKQMDHSRLEEAIRHFDDAVEMYEAVLGAKHPDTCFARTSQQNANVKKVKLIQDDHEREALLFDIWAKLNENLQALQAAYNGPHRHVAITLNTLFVAGHAFQKEEKRLLAMQKKGYKGLSEEEKDTEIQTFVRVSDLHLKRKGLEHLTQCVAVYDTLNWTEHDLMENIVYQLAWVQRNSRKNFDAAMSYQRSANLTRTCNQGRRSSKEVIRWFWAAQLLAKTGKHPEDLVHAAYECFMCLDEVEKDEAELAELEIKINGDDLKGPKAAMGIRALFHCHLAVTKENNPRECFAEYKKAVAVHTNAGEKPGRDLLRNCVETANTLSPDQTALLDEALLDAQQLLEIPEEDPLEQAYNIQLQGKLYLRLKRQKDAAEAYSKAHAIYVAQVNRDDIDEVEKGSAYYNLACIRGLLGDTEGALQSIVAATEYDWALYEEAQQDDDLEALWEHPKFKSIQVRRVWGRIKHHHVGTAKKMRRSHWQQSLLDAAEDAVTAELDLSVDTAPSTREEYTERFD